MIPWLQNYGPKGYSSRIKPLIVAKSFLIREGIEIVVFLSFPKRLLLCVLTKDNG